MRYKNKGYGLLGQHARLECLVFLGLALCFRIRQHTSAYVSIRQHTGCGLLGELSSLACTVLSGFGLFGLAQNDAAMLA